MAKQRRRRRRNPTPKGPDVAILVGLVAVAGGIGYYLYTQSQAAAALPPALQSTAPGYGQTQTITLSNTQPTMNVPVKVGTTVSVALPAGATWVSSALQGYQSTARSGTAPLVLGVIAATSTTTFTWSDSSGTHSSNVTITAS